MAGGWLAGQVRHPIRVLSTLMTRCAQWDNFWRWIASVRGCEPITEKETPLVRARRVVVS